MWSNISPAKSQLKQELTTNVRLMHNTQQQSSASSDPSYNGMQVSGGEENELRVESDELKPKLEMVDSGSPVMRYKHAVCSSASGYIYIHGGRFGNLPLDDDVWRFDPHHNNWFQLKTSGCKPPNLQEHTLVEYKEQLYLFGGQVSASNNENSFWRLDLAKSEWQSLSVKSSKFGAHLGPTNRRGHSAVIHCNSMYIYGGFEDFRGSSNQLWEFQLASQRWELRNLSSSSACHPEPRHSHSAIVYGDSMYIYGGLSNLKPLSDLWRWSWPEKRWFKERTRGSSPGQLHGHTAIQAFGSMFVFGGERNGRTTRSLWRLNLSNMSWQKIRPKGPRPNPTTWHGAIANPLSILDEANYIVEGDPDLLLRSSQENRDVSFCNGNLQHQLKTNQANEQAHLVQSKMKLEPPTDNRDHQVGQSIPQTQSVGHLTHSKSSSSVVGAPYEMTAGSHAQHPNQERYSKRKSRLGFLRGRSRHAEATSRSTYELKRFSFNNPVIPKSDPARHSVSVAPSAQSATVSGAKKSGRPLAYGATETNVDILENLDTDIKEMFQQALSPNRGPIEQIDMDHNEFNGDISMSVEMTTTSHSQYQTAKQAIDSVNDIMLRSSQRTSYAYTTPPSELNTLRGGDSSTTLQSSSSHDQRPHQVGGILDKRYEALLRTGIVQSGYSRRSNRPKSEIVQSLIDEADDGIKNLYKSVFNHQPNSSNKQQIGGILFDNKRLREQGSIDQQRRLHLDKSKRHTIHQTKTYYNLCFHEDNRSSNESSPPSDLQQNSNEGFTSNQTKLSNSNKFPAKDGQIDVAPNPRMVRDDLSSCTIKGGDRLTTSGALVGIHLDQGSQLSFDLASSDSRTLCGDSNGGHYQHNLLDSSEVTFANGGTNGFCSTSLQNALTARRDTEASCDNTSLSFSAIGEYEEDDLLQYSSPTDLVGAAYETARKTTALQQERKANGYVDDCVAEEQVTSQQVNLVGLEMDDKIQPDSKPDELIAPHKSTSSGYDSISGYEQRAQEKSRSSIQQVSSCSVEYQANNSDTQEDSSVRTESSMGGFTTETSPELSATKNSKCKKMKSRPMQHRKSKLNPKVPSTISSTTADSLALTSESFGSYSMAATQSRQPPAISLPSISPNIGQHSMQQTSTSCKMPLVSQSKFFSKRKSKNRYWQLCMFVIGGKQGGVHGMNEPITIWRLYI